jgi:hypothetical protein
MSHVYFIKSGRGKGSPIKIGVARDVMRRLNELQIGNPLELVLLASFKANSEAHAYWLEKNLHRFFKEDHIRGEWFGKVNMRKAEKICSTRPKAEQGKNARKKDIAREMERAVDVSKIN